MELDAAQQQRLNDILDGATASQKENFYTLIDLIPLSSPEEAERLAAIAKIHGFRLLYSHPQTLKQNIDAITPELGVSVAEYVSAVIKSGNPSIFAYPADTIMARLTELSTLFNVTQERVTHAMWLRPAIISYEPKMLFERAQAISKTFDLPQKDVLKFTMSYPVMLTVKIEKMVSNIDALSALTGVDRSILVSKGLMESMIFTQDPVRLHNNLKATAAVIGIPVEQYITLALRRPTLFSLNPKRVESNIEQSAQQLQIGRDEFIAMAVRSPELFTLKPETLAEKMSATSERLGITPEQFMEGAKKYPPVMMLKSETVGRHADLIARTYRAAGQQIDNAEIVDKIAKHLGRSDEALIGRMLVAQKGLMDAVPKHVLRQPNARIQNLLGDHYEGRLTGDPAKDVKVTRTLQQLHRLGVIKELPEGIAPMEPAQGR